MQQTILRRDMTEASKTTSVIEYIVGPDTKGIRYCLKCLEPIKEGEAWLKIWDAEHLYSIGVHSGCNG